MSEFCEHETFKDICGICHRDARITALRAEVERLRAALEPFADMGRAMMGRKHHNEAVVQYALAPTIFVFHLVAAHTAIAQPATDTQKEKSE